MLKKIEKRIKEVAKLPDSVDKATFRLLLEAAKVTILALDFTHQRMEELEKAVHYLVEDRKEWVADWEAGEMVYDEKGMIAREEELNREQASIERTADSFGHLAMINNLRTGFAHAVEPATQFTLAAEVASITAELEAEFDRTQRRMDEYCSLVARLENRLWYVSMAEALGDDDDLWR